MLEYSLICCYNRESEVNILRDSLKEIDERIEWILLDNRFGKFKSAAEALNYGAKLAHGRVLVFVHQDIVFLDTESFIKLAGFAMDNDAVVGVAGFTAPRKPMVSSIFEGENKNKKFNTAIDNTVVCSCDECLFCVKNDLFWKIGGFDSVNFDGWHLYAADLCYEAKKKGFATYVLPAEVWHKSAHTHLDRSFFVYFNKLKRKNRNHEKIVISCCWWDYSGIFLSSLLKAYRFARCPIRYPRLIRGKG